MDQTVIDALSQAEDYPGEVLARAVADPELVAGPVLAALERTASGEILPDPEANLVFWGLHALGATRDTRAFQPLMRLLGGRQEPLDAVFADDIPDTLPRLVASLFDGNADALMALAGHRTADSLLRMMLLGTLAFLTAQGRIPVEATRAFLVRFDDERLAEEGDDVWLGWQDAVALLGFADLADRVDAQWKDGRVPADAALEEGDFRELLDQAMAEPDSPDRFVDLGYGYLGPLDDELAFDPDDPDLSDRYERLEPVRNPYRTVGRNDPCPCGSGVKFKKCCIDKVPGASPA